MSINYGSRIVAEVAVRHLSGAKGIGINQLRFSIAFNVPAWPEQDLSNIECRNFRARVLVAPPGNVPLVLGWAVPEALLTLTPSKYSNEQALLFDLDLADEQLHAIEELRSGADLQFEIEISGDATGPQGIQRLFEKIPYQVNVSAWCNVLRQLGFADILVVGVELPHVHHSSPLAKVTQTIRRAHDSLHQGLYEIAVAQCRHAIEALQAGEGEKKAVIASVEKFQTARAKMSKLDRERFIGEAVRHYTHLAHHLGDDGDFASFSRSEATAVIALTISALATAIRREKLEAISSSE
jgi:hypothetical protein